MPGERLQEVRIANMLDVSPAPVREAFRMLAMEGLIRIDPWKGAVVQCYSSEEILDVVQCRVALETLALKLAYQNMGSSWRKKLKRILPLHRKAAMSAQRFMSMQICTSFGYRAAIILNWIAFVDQLNDVVLREMNFSADDAVRRQEIMSEHIMILRALKAGNIDQAVAALSLHIYNGYYYAAET